MSVAALRPVAAVLRLLSPAPASSRRRAVRPTPRRPQLVADHARTRSRGFPNSAGDVEFPFDEVVSEGGSPNQGAGTGDLEKLVILSPTQARSPRSGGGGTGSRCGPSEGWRPNRVYRVELLPGVTDLQRNRSDRGAVVTFTTGAPRPQTTLRRAGAWTGPPAVPPPAALVVATLLPDSLPYRGLADSAGRFSLGPLPPGEYIVSGVLDQNQNHLGRPARGVRQRAGPARAAKPRWRAVGVRARHHPAPHPRRSPSSDSVSAAVAFTQKLDPRQRLQPSAVTVSTASRLHAGAVAVGAAAAPWTTASTAKRPAGRDSTAADTDGALPADTPPPGRAAARVRRPATEKLTSRPPLTDQLVLRRAAAVAARVDATSRDPRRPERDRRRRRRGRRARRSRAPRARFARARRRLAEAGADTTRAPAGTGAEPQRPRSRAKQAAPTKPPSRAEDPVTDRRRELPSVDRLLLEPAVQRAAPHRAARRGRGRGARVPRRGPHPPGRAARQTGRPTFASGSPTAPVRASARCSTPPASCCTPTSAARRSRRRPWPRWRRSRRLQQPRARSRHRHPRQPQRSLPRAASRG